MKLDEPTVERLLAAGDAEPFAPSGKRFREWASVPVDLHDRWEQHLHDALEASARRRVDRGRVLRRGDGSASDGATA